MRLQVWAWKCDVVTCGHAWLASDVVPPPQCAKCKSRKWHTKPKDILDQAIERAPEGKPTMQELRDICVGQATSPFVSIPIIEIPICGKDWWEEGDHFECMMDAGHREQKHGLRGMVRKLDA